MWQALINLVNQISAFIAQLTNAAEKTNTGQNNTPNIYK